MNPVPVSLCRALGAEIVIAVDLGWDLVGRRATLPELQGAKPGAAQNALIDSIFGRFRERTLDPAQSPSLKDVVLTSLNIMQVRITQSRLAGEPSGYAGLNAPFNAFAGNGFAQRGIRIIPVHQVHVQQAAAFFQRFAQRGQHARRQGRVGLNGDVNV